MTCFSSLAAASPSPQAREAAASLDAQLDAARRYSATVVVPAASSWLAAAHDWLRDVGVPALSTFATESLLPAAGAAALWTRDVALPAGAAAASDAYVLARDVVIPAVQTALLQMSPAQQEKPGANDPARPPPGDAMVAVLAATERYESPTVKAVVA